MKTIAITICSLLICTLVNAQQFLYNPSLQETLVKKRFTYYVTTLIDSLVLKNGTVVYENGKVKKPNGKVHYMTHELPINQHGQRIIYYEWQADVNGKPVTQYIIKVWQVLNQPIELQNGVYAMPNGTLKLPNGICIKMKPHDIVGYIDDFNLVDR